MIEDALADVGYPKEGRPFAPHLTLGRVKDDCTNGRLRDGAVAAEVQEVEQVVDAVVLMQSKLTPGGAEYTQVARFQLGHVAKSQ